MNGIFVFIIGVIIGGVGVWFLVCKKVCKKECCKPSKHSEGEGSGISGYVRERAEAKEQNKNKIMKMIEGKDKITNQEVEETLEVSDATATRYLDELEKEGKLVQKGESKGTYYIKQ